MHVRPSLLLSILPVLLIPNALQAQTAYQSKPVHGLVAIVTNPKWIEMRAGNILLDFDCKIQHVDGSPLASEPPPTFLTATPVGTPQAPPNQNIPLFPKGLPALLPGDGDNINVSGWTLNKFDSTAGHLGWVETTYNGQLSGDVRGLNPSAAAAHIEFDVIDPGANKIMSTSQTSIAQFNNVQIPTVKDVKEPLNLTCTTPWGVVVTLNGITRETDSGSGGSGKDSTNYDFTVDRHALPDDDVSVTILTALDGGVPIAGIRSIVAGGTDNKTRVSARSGPIDAAVHKTADLSFKIVEKSPSKGESIVRTPLDVTVPLKGIPSTATQADTDVLPTTTVSSGTFTLKQVNSKPGSSSEYVIWTRSSDPKVLWMIAGLPSSTTSNAQYSGLAPVAYINGGNGKAIPVYEGLSGITNAGPDNLPLLTNEYGVHYVSASKVVPHPPITLVASPVAQRQQVYTFTNIKIPAPGQSLVVNQYADGTHNGPILRSIKWKGPATEPNSSFQKVDQGTSCLELEYVFAAADSETVLLTLLNARDDMNDALCAMQQCFPPSSLSPIATAGNGHVFVIETYLPSSVSKTISTNVYLTQDIPAGSPINLTIDSNGNWVK
jgi:hypothetical protein